MFYNPFIPQNKAKIAIVDGRVNDEIIKSLYCVGVEVIKTCKCKELYEAISYHPDIVMHPINYKSLVIAPNVYDYYKDIFSFYGIKVIKGERELKRNYPENIAYNVARISQYAVHNTKYTDPKLKFYLEKEGIEFINVKQGYSKCSLAVINDRAAITSDISICKALIGKGMDVLLIKEGFIELPGLNYGFIGGATGMLSKKELLFSGTFFEHPSINNINKFLKNYNIKTIFLSNKRIIDIGSIITL